MWLTFLVSSARCGRKVNLESSVKPRYLNFSSGPIMTSSILSAGGSDLRYSVDGNDITLVLIGFIVSMFLEHQEVVTFISVCRVAKFVPYRAVSSAYITDLLWVNY